MKTQGKRRPVSALIHRLKPLVRRNPWLYRLAVRMIHQVPGLRGYLIRRHQLYAPSAGSGSLHGFRTPLATRAADLSPAAATWLRQLEGQ